MGDLGQTAVIDLSKVILSLVVPRLEHNALVVRAKRHNCSAIAALYLWMLLDKNGPSDSEW